MGRQEHPVNGERDWTNAKGHDPGITIAEVLAYTVIAAVGAAAFARWRTRRNAHRLDTTG